MGIRHVKKVCLVLAAVATATTAGCKGFNEGIAIPTTAGILEGSIALNQEADLDLIRMAAPASLKTVESFLMARPDQPILLRLVAQGYCEYGQGFLEDDLEQANDRGDEAAAKNLTRRATNAYIRCMNYGMRMIGEKKWRKAVAGDLAGFEKALKLTGRGDVPGLFFMGLGLASAININRDNYELLTHLPKVEKVMLRIVKLNEKFFNGGAHLVLGSLYSSQGAAVGGKPEEGLKHLQAAIAIAKGRFLLHKVILARVYAVTKGDQALFEKTIKEVLRAKPDIWPEYRLANEIAKHKARRYWKTRKDLF